MNHKIGAMEYCNNTITRDEETFKNSNLISTNSDSRPRHLGGDAGSAQGRSATLEA